MNNERNDNVVGRLGSQSHAESRNERMRSVSTEAGKDEPGTRQREGTNEEVLPSYAVVIGVLGTALIGTIIVCLVISRMWNEDEIKLHVLSSTIKLLQGIARVSGSWALECENTYNKHVNALH